LSGCTTIHRADLALLQAAGGRDLHVQSAVEDFLFEILQKALGLLVADALGVAPGTEALADEDDALGRAMGSLLCGV
jgi:hypothetical protein